MSDRTPLSDVDALMDEWRQRLAAQRGAARSTSPERAHDAPASQGDSFTAGLRQAASLADVGESLPSLRHLGALRRTVAALVGRVLLYFLRLITIDQRQFNHSLLFLTGTLRAEQTDAERRLTAVEKRLASMDGASNAAKALGVRLVAEAFRGSEEELRGRQQHYLRHFEGCSDVLDVGCGRGEFLGLLHDAGVRAVGVDADREMALWCQEKGLDVICADALTYLEEQPDASFGGIFCAQLVEHLSTPDMCHLVELARRKLRTGAPLVIETLNPESLLVLYRWYWIDLTHQRLVHPRTLELLLRSLGFTGVEVEFLPPPDGPVRIPPLHLADADAEEMQRFNEATQYLNELLYGSFDYAVIGVR